MILQAQPLSKERFSPFGDVIETLGAEHYPINAGSIERFHDLCKIDAEDGGRVMVSIVKCNQPSVLPYKIEVVERHSLGSQAFIPLGSARMVIVVGPPNETVQLDRLQAFVSDGRQGINYRPGVWHMPLIAFSAGLEFIVVDRGGADLDCDEVRIDDAELFVDCEQINIPSEGDT